MNLCLKVAGMILISMTMVCAAGLAQTGADKRNSVIVTESGPLQGIATGAVNEYLGIPYAAPPIGALRWLSPQKFGRWLGVLQATQFGSECIQPSTLFGRPPFDENCLFLNIFTPKDHRRGDDNGAGLPVMVWIHGGGLVEGGADLYDPSPLVTQGRVVVVTINYRLGLLGFFAHPALDAEGHRDGNYGLMDQQFALRWVRRNIAAFGGNPRNITIFGESAGGLSVYSQLASPTAAGLFQRAIVESGAIASFADYQPWIIPLAAAETSGSLVVPAGTALASGMGCSDQTAACLRAIPAATLTGVVPAQLYPFVDGVLLTTTPGAAFDNGQFNRVPVIAGTNHDEYRLFVAVQYDLGVGPLTNDEYETAVMALWGPILGPIVLANYPLPANPPADAASLAFANAVTDGIFSCTARTGDQLLAQYVPTYAYEFNDENAPSAFTVSFPLGAYHGAELQYLFVYAGVPATFTPDQQALSNSMVSYWTQFARTGNPNSPDQPAWPAYNSDDDEFLSLVPPTPIIESTFSSDHLCSALWDSL